MDDELLDIVNREDQVVGTINRQDYDRLVSENLGYIRAVDLFILNSQGKIFVPVRTAHKTIAPNGFDYSVGGHVGAGEDYEETILREAKEELDLNLELSQLELIDKTITDDIRYIRWMYLFRSDSTPVLNPDDFVSAEWLHPDQLIEKIDQGHPAKGKLRDSVVILKEYLAGHNQ